MEGWRLFAVDDIILFVLIYLFKTKQNSFFLFPFFSSQENMKDSRLGCLIGS
jgi:hypothetical protein